MSDLDFQAGQTIRLTLTSVPRNKAQTSTIARLMRRDPTNERALRRAQRLRKKRMHSYIRGGREWFNREHPAKVVRVATGESWEMPFTYDIAPDLKSVMPYLTIEKV